MNDLPQPVCPVCGREVGPADAVLVRITWEPRPGQWAGQDLRAQDLGPFHKACADTLPATMPVLKPAR